MPPPQGQWNPIEGPGDFTTTRTVHDDTHPAIDPTKADLAGKTVFVVGASRGLGKSIAISYAKAGASCIVIGARSNLTDVEKDVKAVAATVGRKEPQVLSLKLDVTSAKSVNEAAKEIETAFGKLDVVILNAGILGKRQAIAESDPEEWWETMTVNLRGPYLISRFCIPLLLKSELKTLITISSVGAHRISPSLSDYQTSKLAVLRLTDFIAAENADKGLVAFTVHPGNMLTDIVNGGEGMSPEMKAIFTETTELCADGLVYLSKPGFDWLSGRYVNMTWDLPELTSAEMKEKIIRDDLLKVKLLTPNFE